MRRMLLALFTALCFSSSAQITITAATFPAVGDTFKIAFDMNPPTSINPATAPGGNQLWDFTGLDVSQTDEIIYQSADAGVNSMSFPGGDLAVIGANGETFYNITNTQMQVMGYAGVDQSNLGIQVLAKYSPVVVERYAPLNFFDAFD